MAIVEKNFNVPLTVKFHPKQVERAKCYCFQVLLLIWNETDERHHSRENTPGGLNTAKPIQYNSKPVKLLPEYRSRV
jgi:hypothetical protein